MNIFALDECPINSAQYAVDKHVIKMILESAQLLCTAHHTCPTNVSYPAKFYKPTHKNHPCSIWVRESVENYKWLCDHAIALCDEYEYRYGKKHASLQIIEWCSSNIPNIPSVGLTPFKMAMPDKYKTDNPVYSYRMYYFYDKRLKFNCTWKLREKPGWWLSFEALEELTKQAQELNMGY